MTKTFPKNERHPSAQALLLLGMGLLIGLLMVIQMRSYDTVTALVVRDPASIGEGLTTTEEIFHQIYTLKLANKRLENEISTVEAQLEDYSDQTLAYDTLVTEIEKNEALLGSKPISGSGLTLTVHVPLTLEDFVDLTNELWAAGAEAVQIEGIRLMDSTDGFYTINEWVLLSGQVLELPYTFEAIGDADVMQTLLNQPGGMIARLGSLEFTQTPLTFEAKIDKLQKTL